MAQIKGKPEEVAFEIFRLLRPLHRGIDRRLGGGHRGKGMTTSMREVLDLLAEIGPATLPFLARALILKRQPVKRSVDLAILRGFVAHESNPAHRLSPFLALTRAGLAERERIRKDELRELRVMAAPFEIGELAKCLEVLQHLRIELGMIQGEAARRMKAHSQSRFR